MSIQTVHTVREARATLPALIASTHEGRMPIIGGHRKPDAVLISAGILGVLDLLLHAFAEKWARLILDGANLKRGDVIHPGDPMGTVITWLWQSGQHGRLDELISVFMTTLRERYDYPTPRLRLADLINGIPMALPDEFPEQDVPALLDFIRETVPHGFNPHPDEA